MAEPIMDWDDYDAASAQQTKHLITPYDMGHEDGSLGQPKSYEGVPEDRRADYDLGYEDGYHFFEGGTKCYSNA